MKFFKTLPTRSAAFFVLVFMAALMSVGCSDSNNDGSSTGNPLSAYQPTTTTTTLPVTGQTTGVGAIDTPIVNVPTDADGTDHTNAPLLDNWHPGWQQGDCFGCHTDQSRIPDHSYPDTSLCYLCHGTNGLPGFGDNVAPLVKGIIAHPTLNSVTINWTTDEPCISRLILRTKEGDRLEFPVSTEYVTSHKYTVSGLLSNTTYTYEIVATDKNRNVTSTSSCATLSFTTLVATATVTTTTATATGTEGLEFFSTISVFDIKSFSAKLRWTTRSDAKCYVHSKAESAPTERVLEMDTVTTTFEGTLVQLLPKTKYTIYVVGYDTSGQEYISTKVEFQTAAN